MSENESAEKSGVWGVWYGGASYSPGEVIRDLEYWEDITEARGALLDRYSHGDWEEQTFNYVNSPVVGMRTPAVGEDSVIHIYLSRPGEWGNTDYYPDRELSIMFDHDDEAMVHDGAV